MQQNIRTVHCVCIKMSKSVNYIEHSLVIEQNIRALNVSVQKVLLVAIIKTFQQLSHEGFDVALIKMDQARLKQAHQVVVHVFKYKVEST